MALVIIGGQRTDQFAAEARRQAPAGLEVRAWPEVGCADDVRYALAWGTGPGTFKGFPNLELIVSVGAGVDHLMRDPELPRVPIVRYVDADLTGRMTAYIGLQVLFHQRRMSEYLELQRSRTWEERPEPAAHEVRVGLMGLGVLGQAAARALAAFGFRLRGWCRTPKSLEGIECFAGASGLDPFLAGTDILACLLPLTPDTRGILDRGLLRKLSRHGRHPRLPGPVLINAGRGGLQVEGDLLAALEAGELYAASLDVFETEPLPGSSPLWGHPRVVLTPHVAAESKPDAIVRYALAQLVRHRAGLPPENVIDRGRGY